MAKTIFGDVAETDTTTFGDVAEVGTVVEDAAPITEKPIIPAADTWDYILGGGKWEDILPITVAEPYKQIRGRALRKDLFDDRMNASLYMAVLTSQQPSMFYEGPEAYARELFGEELSPSQIMQRAVKNDKFIKGYVSNWNQMIKSRQSTDNELIRIQTELDRKRGILPRPRKGLYQSIDDATQTIVNSGARIAIAGTRLAADFLTRQGDVPQRPLLPAVDAWAKKNAKLLSDWSEQAALGMDDWARNHPDEAIWFTPGSGYFETLMEVVTSPEIMIQGMIESAPVIIAGTAAHTVGGPLPWVGRLRAIGTMGLPVAAEKYGEVRHRFPDQDPWVALAQASLTGLGEGIIEEWTLGKKLGILERAPQIFGRLGSVLWEGTKAFFRGTAEEGSQQLQTNFWQWLFTDRSQELLEGVAQSAAMGGPLELAMAGGFASTGLVIEGAERKFYPEAQQLRIVEALRKGVVNNPDFTDAEQAEIFEVLDTVEKDVKDGVFEAQEAAKAAEKAPTAPAKAIKPAEAPITAPKAEIKAPAGEKQPFEMTLDEFKEAHPEEGQLAITSHMAHIREAVQQGKDISADVLKDHPELAKGIEQHKAIQAIRAAEQVSAQPPKAAEVKLPKEPTTLGDKADITGIMGGVPRELTVGLTKAEVEFLGKSQQKALRAAQKMGLPAGYKKGYQVAVQEGRRKLGALRLDIKLGEKARKDATVLIKEFVPKEEQGRYLKRLSEVKPGKKFNKLADDIDTFIKKYDQRKAMRDFKNFVKKTRKKYRRGELPLGKLTGPAKTELESALSKYDTVKLSEAKEEELQKHEDHIQNIAGSIANTFREWETVDEQGIDIIELPNRRIQDLERLQKTPLSEMEADDIRYLQDELQSLITNEQRKNQIRDNIRSERSHTYITDASNEVYDRETTPAGETNIPGAVRKLTDIEQANLRTLAREIVGPDASATEEFLVDRIYAALRDSAVLRKKWYLDARREFTALGMGDAFMKDYYSDVTMTLGGKTFTGPKWILLNIWMNAEADGNLKRLLTASEHRVYKTGKPIDMGKISREELQKVAEQIPEQWKKLATVMFRLNRENNAPAINETSQWERGYPLAVYEKYFPFPRYLRDVPSGHKTEVQLATENRGRYQKRTGGTLPHKITDPLMTFLNGMQQDAQYASMVLAQQDAKALLGDAKWRGRQDRAGNAPFVKALMTIYQRAEGLASDKDIADFLAGKYLGTMGKGTLSLRPSGGFIQMASIPAAYGVVEKQYFDRTYIPSKADAQALMEKDATMYWRWEARHYDYVLGAASARDSVRQMVTGKRALKDALLTHYTWGDQWAVLKIRNAVENKIAQAVKEDDGDAGLEAIAQNWHRKSWSELDTAQKKKVQAEYLDTLFHRALETQPQWDTWHRSVFTSETGAFKRSFAMFMSARNAQWNVILQAADDIKKDRIDKYTGYRRIGDIVEASFRVSLYRRLFRKMVKYVAIGALFAIGKKDEDDIKEHIKKDIKLEAVKIPTETITNMIGLPVYGQLGATLATEMLKGVSGKWSGVKFGDVRTGSVLTDFVVDMTLAGYDTAKFARDVGMAALDDPDAYFKSGPRKGQPRWLDSGLSAVNDGAEIVSQLTGFPYSGPRSDIVWPVKTALRKQKKKKRLTLEE